MREVRRAAGTVQLPRERLRPCVPACLAKRPDAEGHRECCGLDWSQHAAPLRPPTLRSHGGSSLEGLARLGARVVKLAGLACSTTMEVQVAL